MNVFLNVFYINNLHINKNIFPKKSFIIQSKKTTKFHFLTNFAEIYSTNKLLCLKN